MQSRTPSAAAAISSIGRARSTRRSGLTSRMSVTLAVFRQHRLHLDEDLRGLDRSAVAVVGAIVNAHRRQDVGAHQVSAQTVCSDLDLASLLGAGLETADIEDAEAGNVGTRLWHLDLVVARPADLHPVGDDVAGGRHRPVDRDVGFDWCTLFDLAPLTRGGRGLARQQAAEAEDHNQGAAGSSEPDRRAMSPGPDQGPPSIRSGKSSMSDASSSPSIKS